MTKPRKCLGLLCLLLLPVDCYPLVCVPQSADALPIRDSHSLLSTLLEARELSQAFGVLSQHKALITALVCQRLASEANTASEALKYDRGILLYRIAIEAAAQSNNKRALPYAWYRLGRVYYEKGDLKSAIDASLQSKQASEEMKSETFLIYALSDLGTFNIHAGDYQQAKKYSLECLTHAVSLRETAEPILASLARYGIAAASANLGHISQWEGDYQKALSYLHDSIELFKEMSRGNRTYETAVADRMVDLAQLHQKIGDYAQSLRNYTQAIALFQKLNANDRLRAVLNDVGLLYLEQGDFSTSTRYLDMSLSASLAANDKIRAARTLSNIGVANQRHGHYEKSLQSFQRALALCSDAPSSLVIVIEEGLGTVYQARAEYRIALAHYNQALRLADRIGDRERRAELLWRKGEISYLQGDYDEAMRLSESAYSVASELSLPNICYLALTLQGRSLNSQRKSEEANQCLSQALDIIEHIREKAAGQEQQRALFFEGKLTAYHLMIESLINQNKQSEALIYAERAKGRILLEVVEAGKVNANGIMTPVEREQERKLNSKIVALNTRIYSEKVRKQIDESALAELTANLDKARLEYQTLMDGVYVAHPELRSRVPVTAALRMEQLRALSSDAHTSYLEFVVMDDKTYLFVISKDKSPNPGNEDVDIKSFEIKVKKAELKGLVETFRERLANPHFPAENLARKLYDLLLGSARELLANKTALVVVPDGILWELPFQALRQPQNRYLIEDHALSYAPSLNVLAEMSSKRLRQTVTSGKQSIEGALAREQRNSPLTDLLAFGNPQISTETIERATRVHRDSKLLPLPEAEREVKSLAQLYGSRGSKVYVGAQAREETAKVEIRNYRVLHFATHGILDSANPMYSHIVLSRAEGTNEDGLLEAWELVQMNLAAEIVVLSACETARGQIGAGEGVIGLSWAFFVAGCPTTVVSQWQVDSASTTALMIEFHKNLISGSKHLADGRARMTKAEALRQAMLTLLRDDRFKTPYFWAGFVVVGDGG